MKDTKVLELVNSAINVPLALTTTLGNTLILAAIWKTPSLHSATNTLVFGLALSDLGVGLISQPLGVSVVLSTEFLKNSSVLVTIFQIFSGSVSAGSLLTVTAIGVDRYLALKLHLRYKELVTVRRVVYVLVVIWVGCILAPVFSVWQGNIFLFYYAASPVIAAYLLINFFVYQKLYRVCRFHHASIRDQAIFQDAQLYQRAINEARFRKSVKTIFFILLALVLCYLPFCCYTVAVVVVGDSRLSAMASTMYQYTWTIVFANSTANPALLYFQLTELRLAIKRILKKLCGCQRKNQDLGTISNVGTLQLLTVPRAIQDDINCGMGSLRAA